MLATIALLDPGNEKRSPPAGRALDVQTVRGHNLEAETLREHGINECGADQLRTKIYRPSNSRPENSTLTEAFRWALTGSNRRPLPCKGMQAILPYQGECPKPQQLQVFDPSKRCAVVVIVSHSRADQTRTRSGSERLCRRSRIRHSLQSADVRDRLGSRSHSALVHGDPEAMRQASTEPRIWPVSACSVHSMSPPTLNIYVRVELATASPSLATRRLLGPMGSSSQSSVYRDVGGIALVSVVR